MWYWRVIWKTSDGVLMESTGAPHTTMDGAEKELRGHWDEILLEIYKRDGDQILQASIVFISAKDTESTIN